MARKPPAAAVDGLYATPVMRNGIWTVLLALLLFNVFQVAWGLFCAIVAYVPWKFLISLPTAEEWRAWPTPGHRAALFFFYCAIPVIACGLCIVDTYKRWRKTLSPKRVVISGLTGVLLWAIMAALWFNCVWLSIQVWYWNALAFYDDPTWTMPLICLFEIVLYSVYILFGVIAGARQRGAQLKEVDSGSKRDSQASLEWKAPTPALTTPDTISDRHPSTLRYSQSIEPSTAPPSYSSRHSTLSNESRPSSSVLP